LGLKNRLDARETVSGFSGVTAREIKQILALTKNKLTAIQL